MDYFIANQRRETNQAVAYVDKKYTVKLDFIALSKISQ